MLVEGRLLVHAAASSSGCTCLAGALQPGVTTDAIDKAVHQMIIDSGAYPSPLNYGERVYPGQAAVAESGPSSPGPFPCQKRAPFGP
jgi:hypothetical protein